MITARRPLGTAALTALAAWVLLGQVLWPIFRAGSADPGLSPVLSYVDSLVQFTLALIAVVQITRAGVVPRLELGAGLGTCSNRLAPGCWSRSSRPVPRKRTMRCSWSRQS